MDCIPLNGAGFSIFFLNREEHKGAGSMTSTNDLVLSLVPAGKPTSIVGFQRTPIRVFVLVLGSNQF